MKYTKVLQCVVTIKLNVGHSPHAISYYNFLLTTQSWVTTAVLFLCFPRVHCSFIFWDEWMFQQLVGRRPKSLVTGVEEKKKNCKYAHCTFYIYFHIFERVSKLMKEICCSDRFEMIKEENRSHLVKQIFTNSLALSENPSGKEGICPLWAPM